MKSRRNVAVVAVLLAMGAVGAWLTLPNTGSASPRWKGRTMAEWIDRGVAESPAPTDSMVVRRPAPDEVAEAARALGADAVPDLVGVLRERDSPLLQYELRAWARLPGWAQRRVAKPGFRARQRSMIALACLGEVLPHAGPATLALVDRMQSDKLLESWIVDLLGAMGSEAAPAVPALAAKLNATTNPFELPQLARTLWKIGPVSLDAFQELARSPNAAAALTGEVGRRWLLGDTNGVVELLEARLFDSRPTAGNGVVKFGFGPPVDGTDPAMTCAETLADKLGPRLEPMRTAVLRHLLSDESPALRKRAAHLLAVLGPGNQPEASVNVLLAAARHETARDVLRAELQAIGEMRLCSDEVETFLERHLHGADEETIEMARAALDKLLRADDLDRRR